MRKILLLLVGCVALGAMLWLGLRSKLSNGGSPEAPTEASIEPAAVEPATNRAARVFQRSARHRERAAVEVPGATNITTEWEAKIDEVLASDGTDEEIGMKLLELYPGVPVEGQPDLMLEIASRTANTNYSQLANLITNTATHADVTEVLLTDLLDRPDSLHMPLLLEMARSKNNPKSEDARDLLEALLGEDYGEDWNQWAKKISEWLASHPE